MSSLITVEAVCIKLSCTHHLLVFTHMYLMKHGLFISSFQSSSAVRVHPELYTVFQSSYCQSRIIYSVSKLLLSIQDYLQCFQALTVSVTVNPKVCASVSKLLLSIQNYERLFQALTVNPELHAMYQSHTVNPELHAVFQSDSVLVSIQDDVQCFKVLIQLLSIQKYHVQCFKVLIFNPKLCAVFQSSYCQTRIMSSVSKFFFVKPELCASFQSSYCSSSIMHYVLKFFLSIRK